MGLGEDCAIVERDWKFRRTLTAVYTRYIQGIYMAEFDVYFKLEDDVFVWNSEKAIENRRKHGIRFERACEVFYDRDVLYVDASTPEEDRMAAIGYTTEDAMLFVVHIERMDGLIRIISARDAEPKERRLYEDGE